MLRIMSYGINTLRSIVGEYMEFSYDEKVIGKWVDGKTVYQKVIEITGPNELNTWVEVLDISDLNVDKMIDMYGTSFYIASSGNKFFNPINSAGYSNNIFLNVMLEENKIKAITNANSIMNSSVTLIIIYTKK